MKTFLSFCAFILTASFAQARDVTIKYVWSLDERESTTTTDPAHFDLLVWDKGTSSIYSGFHFKRNDPAVKKANFTLTDGDKKPVPFDLVLVPPTDNEGPANKKGTFRMIKLYPKSTGVPKKASVTLKAPFDLALAPEDVVDQSYVKGPEISSDSITAYQSAQPRSRFEYKAGKTAAVSFEAQYYKEWTNNTGGLHIGIKGDTSLQKVREKNYFDNLEAFLKLDVGGYFDESRGLAILAAETKIESDRNFEILTRAENRQHF